MQDLMRDVLLSLSYIDGIRRHNDYYVYENDGKTFSSVSIVSDDHDFLANVQLWVDVDSWGVNLHRFDGRHVSQYYSRNIDELDKTHMSKNVNSQAIHIDPDRHLILCDMNTETNPRVIALALFFTQYLNDIVDTIVS